jgi:hypothetical protein
MKQRRRLGVFAAIAFLAACVDGTGSGGVSVTLQVVRGPITPVCQPNVACDAPFAAGFDLYRLNRLRQRVTTGSDGRLELHLSAGAYELIPAADAPLLDPRSQRKSFEVTEPGPVSITLEFDTGIR